MNDKSALRQWAKAARQGWEEEYRQRADAAIARRVLDMEAWRAAETVFAYVSVGHEIDTRALIGAALAQGKRVYAPRCVGRGVMEARLLRGLHELRPAAFGLLEPTESAPAIAPEAIDVLLVPCLAADRDGYRLGYGSGYYDRFLAKAQGMSICLCRARALMPSVPRDAHDAPVDFVITETEIWETKKER